MISVSRIQGVETEYALLDPADPGADPEALATKLLFTYARALAAEGQPSQLHVPAATGRALEAGAGTRFDYSGEAPGSDARGFTHTNLPAEARTNEGAGAALTSAATRWVTRLTPFEAHYYRGSAIHGPNGARLYVDHSHPEYAAPEALGPRAAMRYDLAGDRLMQRAAADLRCVLVKNNADGKGQAWGAHESYLMSRATSWDLITATLLPFLVTRPIIGGAGRVGIGRRSEEPGFQIFARADFIEQETSLYTTRERPIINTRDEPHASGNRWRRLHVITADSSVLAPTILLRLGSLSAVLSLIENHPEDAADLAERFRLADPVTAVRTFSYDPTLSATAPLAAGGQASALQIQRAFLAACRAHRCDAETREVLGLWSEALDALAIGPHAAASLVQWCAKYELLQRLRAKYSCGWDDPRIAAADLQFAMLDPAASLAAALQRAGTIRRIIDDEEIAAAELAAPENTRAGGRAAFLAAYPDQIWAASWTSLVVDSARPHLLRVTLSDPHHPTAAEARAAIAATDSALAALTHLGLDVPPDPHTEGWDEGIYHEPKEE